MKVNTTSLTFLASLFAILLGIKINKRAIQAPEPYAITKTQPTDSQSQKKLKEDERLSKSISRADDHLTTAPAPSMFQINTNDGLLSLETPSNTNSGGFGTSFSW